MYGIQKLVYNIYARVPNGFEKNYEGGRGATLAAATDEAECALSYSSVHRFYNGGWNPNNPFSFTWSNSYAAIAEANTFHEKRDKINLDEYKNNLDFEAMKRSSSCLSMRSVSCVLISILNWSVPTVTCLSR